MEPGERLADRYRVLGEVGRGGMGCVLRGVDEALERDVAIKVLPAESVGDEEKRHRLILEAKAAAAIDHPGVVEVHDVGETEGGDVFVVMELVRGRSLQDAILIGDLDRAEQLRILDAIAAALDATHALGVIHRDVKPGNVMVRPDGRVVLLDFGLVKRVHAPSASSSGEEDTLAVTRSGAILGTPAFIAPEQVKGHATAASDRWSFGVLGFALLTGQLPWDATEVAHLLAQILTEEPRTASEVEPALPPAVDAVFERALQKEPAQRFDSCRAFVEALRAALADAPRAPTRPSGRWTIAALIAVAAVVIAGALFGLDWAQRDPGRAPGPELTPDPETQARAAGPEGWERLIAGVDFIATGGITPAQRLSDGALLLWTTEGLVRLPPRGPMEHLPPDVLGFFSNGDRLIDEGERGLVRRGEGGGTALGVGSEPRCVHAGVHDDDTVFCVSDEAVQLWTEDRGTRTVHSMRESVDSMSFSPSGRRLLLVVSSDVTVAPRRLWMIDLESGDREERELPPGFLLRSPSMVLLDDERVLYVASTDGPDRVEIAIANVWGDTPAAQRVVEVPDPHASIALVEGDDVFIYRTVARHETYVRDLDSGEDARLEAPFPARPLGWTTEGLWLGRVRDDQPWAATPFEVVGSSLGAPVGEPVARPGHIFSHVLAGPTGPLFVSHPELTDVAPMGGTRVWRREGEQDVLRLPRGRLGVFVQCDDGRCYVTRSGARATLSEVDLRDHTEIEILSWSSQVGASMPRLEIVDGHAFIADGSRLLRAALAPESEVEVVCDFGGDTLVQYLAARSRSEVFVSAMHFHEEPYSLLRLRLPSCEPEVLASDSVRWFGLPALSPDGTRLAYFVKHLPSELWRLPGVLADVRDADIDDGIGP